MRVRWKLMTLFPVPRKDSDENSSGLSSCFFLKHFDDGMAPSKITTKRVIFGDSCIYEAVPNTLFNEKQHVEVEEWKHAKKPCAKYQWFSQYRCVREWYQVLTSTFTNESRTNVLFA